MNQVESRAWDALRNVYDPELAIDIVALGLVYAVRDEGDEVVLEITLTTPGCPVAETIPEDARAAVAEAVGPDKQVRVEIVWDPPWTPDLMEPEAAEALGFG
ncbi:MAG: metal-sulfur cluster biosynthetic enzyme [Acidobacteria bacterium]|nr:MAG: metal-sulfur cluster biosynthetic enzyme [Acidobacteriota bacterium]